MQYWLWEGGEKCFMHSSHLNLMSVSYRSANTSFDYQLKFCSKTFYKVYNIAY